MCRDKTVYWDFIDLFGCTPELVTKNIKRLVASGVCDEMISNLDNLG